jgi:formiminotetrahydrofolate cyclodeaminase
MDVRQLPLESFLSAIAGEAVAPAGGTAAAVVGAMGAALCEMGCTHSREWTGGSEAMGDIRDGLADRRTQLLALGTADAELVDDVFGSRDPGSDGDWKRAVGVPLATAESCRDVLELAVVVLKEADTSAVADVRTGVLLAHAALHASLFTVRSNLERVTDESFIVNVDRRMTDVETAAAAAVERATERTDGTD